MLIKLYEENWALVSTLSFIINIELKDKIELTYQYEALGYITSSYACLAGK